MIYDILMSEDKLSVDYLESKKEEIFNIIPELKTEDGFDQKSNWHIYDVWKHTEVALSNSKCDFEERIALLLHDIGKPFSYQDDGDVRHFKGHAKKSAEMSEPILERLGYDKQLVDRVSFLIENHSKVINVNIVNKNNVELFEKLLDIQYCDTKAYNPEKIGPVIHRLDQIREQIEIISTSSLDDEYEER